KNNDRRRGNSSNRRTGSHKGERFGKRNFADRSSASFQESRQTIGQLKAVDKLLGGIGVPEPAPFSPDPFQIEALEAIETEDVLVTAPTGSGKTWIARE